MAIGKPSVLRLLPEIRHEAVLSCTRCGAESVQEVTYLDGSIVKVHCTVCGYLLHRSLWSLRHRYLGRLPRRLLTKPLRLGAEFRSHPQAFVRSLPERAVRKPLLLTRDFIILSGLDDYLI